MPIIKPAILLALLLCPALHAAEQPEPDPEPAIREWDVPWKDTRPRDPYVGPDGDVWFVGQRGHYVAALNPDSGEFRRIDLDQGTGPHNLIVADDGTIYYAGNLAAHIGRIDPKSGEIHKIPMPDERASDPHTLVFDEAGDIFFTVQGGNMVGKLEVATENVTLAAVPTEGARPYGMAVDQDDMLWFVESGLSPNRLVGFDPVTETFTEPVPIPSGGGTVRHMFYDEDADVIWFGADTNTIGRTDLSP